MRLVGAVTRLVGLLVVGTGLAVVVFFAVLHTPAGRTLVRDRLTAVLAQSSGARVTLGAVETPALGTIVLRDLVLSFGGQSLVRVPRLEMAVGLPLPVPPTLRLRRVVVDGAAAHLVSRNGTFGLPRTDAGGGTLRVRIGRLQVRAARLGIVLADDTPARTMAFSQLSLDGSAALGPRGQRLDVTALRVTPRGLPLAPLAAVASVRRTHDGVVDLQAYASSLAARRLRTILPGLIVPHGTTIDATLHGPPSDLRVRARCDLGAAGTIEVRARVDPGGEAPVYRVAVETPGVVPATLHPDWPNARIAAELRARGRGAHHAAHGHLTSDAGRIAWRGRAFLDGQDAYRLNARGEVRDLARWRAGMTGRFPFTIDLAGSERSPRGRRLRAHVELGPGTIQGTTLRRGVATARLEGSRWHVEGLRLVHDDVTLTADALVDPGRGTVEARLGMTSPGRGTADAALALRHRGATWTGTLGTLRVAPIGLAAWRADAPAVLTVGDGVRLRDLHLRSGTQHATVSLDVGRRGALAGTLEAADLQLAPLCTLAGVTCAGQTTARLAVSGTTTAPHFALTATARVLAAGPLRQATMEADVRHARGRATGTLELHGLGGTVRIAGDAPVPLPGFAPPSSTAIDLRLTARRMNLGRFAAMAPTIVRSAAGQARADLHLGGTWASPRPEGTITVRAAHLELAASGARWEDVQLGLRADGGQALVVERLTGRGGTGTLAGTGAFDFRAGIVPAADLRLVFDHFLAVDRPILEASIDGRLRVQGPLLAPTVRGRLYVPAGAIKPAFLPAAHAPTEPDPTIEVVGGANAAPPAQTPGLGDLTLALTFTLGNDVRIRRRDADIQLGGTFRVTRVPPEPLHVAGTIEIERGWYTFSGRRFRLRDGAVRFGGGAVGDAELDIEAGRRSGEYDVTVAIQGTVDHPVLLLSSDPPLDESDVLAVLLVGRPGGELSDRERLGVQAEATSLAMSYAVPGLASGIGEVLPLEQVQVSPEQVRVGHRLGNDVFISLSQQFVGWAGQSVAIEYEVTRRLSVELSTSSRGSGAVDFFWRRRY